MFILFWTKDFYKLRLVCLPLAKFAHIYLISRKWMWVKVQIKENDDILKHRAINSSGYYEPRTGPVFHTPKNHKNMAMQRGRPPSYTLLLLFFFLLLSTGMQHHHLPPSLSCSFTVQFSTNYWDWTSPDHNPYVLGCIRDASGASKSLWKALQNLVRVLRELRTLRQSTQEMGWCTAWGLSRPIPRICVLLLPQMLNKHQQTSATSFSTHALLCHLSCRIKTTTTMCLACTK